MSEFESKNIEYDRKKYGSLYHNCILKLNQIFDKESYDLIIKKFNENNNYFRYIDCIKYSFFGYKNRIMRTNSFDYLVNENVISFAIILLIESLEINSKKIYKFLNNFIDNILYSQEKKIYYLDIDIREFIYPLGIEQSQITLSKLFNGRKFDFVYYSPRANEPQQNVLSPKVYNTNYSKNVIHTNIQDPRLYMKNRPSPIQTQFNDNEYHNQVRIKRPLEYQDRSPSNQVMSVPPYMNEPNEKKVKYEENKNINSSTESMRNQIRHLEEELFSRDNYIKKLLDERKDMFSRIKAQDDYIYSMQSLQRKSY